MNTKHTATNTPTKNMQPKSDAIGIEIEIEREKDQTPDEHYVREFDRMMKERREFNRELDEARKRRGSV